MPADLLLCGLRVRSDIPLPELPPWTGDDRPADIVVRLGETPASLEDARALSPFLTIDAAGRCLFSIPAVADFLVLGGREVVLASRVDPGSTEIRVFLLGTVLGLLCHQRGLFPLHASCVRVGDGAVAFAGPSGAGKSTLAAMLSRDGKSLLADDVCVIDPYGPDGPMVLPTFPRLKLWRDSLEQLGVPIEALDRNRPGQEKFHWRLPTSAPLGATPLRALYLLDRVDVDRPEGVFEISQAPARIAAIQGQVFRREAGEALGRADGMFAGAARIAATTPVRRLIRRLDGPRAWSTADLPETLWTV